MILTVVHFRWEGDGVTALYSESGALIVQGDYYHDKIDEYLDGYFDGIQGVGVAVDRVDLYVSDDEMGECDEVPTLLVHVYRRYKVTEGQE